MWLRMNKLLANERFNPYDIDKMSAIYRRSYYSIYQDGYGFDVNHTLKK